MVIAPPKFPAIIQSAAAYCRNVWQADDSAIAATTAGREKNTAPRRRRAEGRRTIADVCAQLIEFCDLATMTIGWRGNAGSWSARGVRDIAHGCGMQQRRTERALAILTECGHVSVTERKERGRQTAGGWVKDRHGDQYRSRNAVRKLTLSFWRAIGMEVSATRERNHAIKELAKKQPNAADVAAAQVARMTSRLASSKGWRPPVDTKAQADAREHFIIDDALRREDPSLPAGERAARAWEILRARTRQ